GRELLLQQWEGIKKGRHVINVWLKETDPNKRGAFGGEEIMLLDTEATALVNGQLMPVETAQDGRMKFHFGAGDRWIPLNDYQWNIIRCELKQELFPEHPLPHEDETGSTPIRVPYRFAKKEPFAQKRKGLKFFSEAFE
ncbi:MAG TPA: hypothetical protein PLR18_04230, partial [bacterium]|nr:hypothetical protein [bacterium]